MVNAPNRLGMVRIVDRPRPLDELAELAVPHAEIDILLAKGFRNTAPVRVEAVRAERSVEPLCAPGE
ncbi:MAG: hypothetical protein PHQ53_11965 [Candidatus Krumholzibacteria bacterium]|nr:hypothetical protein [Candidatus Krumholzibacteria bacterium]